VASTRIRYEEISAYCRQHFTVDEPGNVHQLVSCRCQTTCALECQKGHNELACSKFFLVSFCLRSNVLAVFGSFTFSSCQVLSRYRGKG
jgi:hypothetical protein